MPTCHDCGSRCSDRWHHPELTEDYYCAACFVSLMDEMIEELAEEREAARKRLHKTSAARGFKWDLVYLGKVPVIPST